jgi:hypothetical protein
MMVAEKGDNNQTVLDIFHAKQMHVKSLSELKDQDPSTIVSIYKDGNV